MNVPTVDEIRSAMDQDYKPTQQMVRVLLKECAALRTRAETAERERDDLKTDIVRFKMHLESAERAAKANAKEATEAYAKGQRDKQGECAEAIRQHLWNQGYILHADAAAQLLMELPIKERP